MTDEKSKKKFFPTVGEMQMQPQREGPTYTMMLQQRHGSGKKSPPRTSESDSDKAA